MITLITKKGSRSCNKLINYYIDHDISFKAYDIEEYGVLTDKLVRHVLTLSTNGFDDILDKRSIAYCKIKNEVENMKLREMIHYIANNSGMVKCPMILTKDSVKCGLRSIGFLEFLDSKEI